MPPSPPPTLSTSTDPKIAYTASFKNTILDGSIAAGMMPSSADVALWRKQREAMIARGENPRAKLEAKQAKNAARKEKLKKYLGLGGTKEKEKGMDGDSLITLTSS